MAESPLVSHPKAAVRGAVCDRCLRRLTSKLPIDSAAAAGFGIAAIGDAAAERVGHGTPVLPGEVFCGDECASTAHAEYGESLLVDGNMTAFQKFRTEACEARTPSVVYPLLAARLLGGALQTVRRGEPLTSRYVRDLLKGHVPAWHVSTRHEAPDRLSRRPRNTSHTYRGHHIV